VSEVYAVTDDPLGGLDPMPGAVELDVRAHPREPEDTVPRGADSRREYMLAKARRTEAARLLHEPLAFLARDCVVQSGPELLCAAYLVDREAVASFVSLVGRLQQAHPGLDVACSGPWPPSSFAEQ
jgi:Gas vesicle synthesis protein GvpL/GvpF